MRTLIFLLFIFPFAGFTQTGSLTVFSESQPFFLYINDVKQNETAKSSVRVDGLQQYYVSARIVFSDLSIPPVFRRNISLVDENDKLMHATYKLKIDKNREVKLHFYSLGKDVKPTSAVTVKKTEPPTIKEGIQPSTVKIKKEEKKTEKEKAETADKVVKQKSSPAESKPAPSKYTVKKCTGWPVVKEDFEKAKLNVIAAKGEANRISAAKSIAEANCLMVSQVMELCKLLPSESSRIAFAKFAYASTIDRHNYTKLKELFKENNNLSALDEMSRLR